MVQLVSINTWPDKWADDILISNILKIVLQIIKHKTYFNCFISLFLFKMLSSINVYGSSSEQTGHGVLV